MCTVLYTNADTLTNKTNELILQIEKSNAKIIAVTEVKPKNSRFQVSQMDLHIKDFDLFLNLETGGRGVCIYTHQSLRAAEWTPTMGKITDAVFVEKNLKNGKKMIIGNIYRSPNSSDEINKKLNDLNKSLDRTRSMDLIIVGDFNYPEINWKISTCDKPAENAASMFLEATRDAYLIQHIKEPTHARINESSNILDLVFTNKEGLVEDCTVGPPLGKSDHATITFSLKLRYNTPRINQNRFQYDKGNYDSLRREIASIDWKSKFEGKMLMSNGQSFKMK